MQKVIVVGDLAAVLTLSEDLNLKTAAKRLKVSESKLRGMVSKLERQLELKLFDSQHANVLLTEAGRIFIEQIKSSTYRHHRGIYVYP